MFELVESPKYESRDRAYYVKCFSNFNLVKGHFAIGSEKEFKTVGSNYASAKNYGFFLSSFTF